MTLFGTLPPPPPHPLVLIKMNLPGTKLEGSVKCKEPVLTCARGGHFASLHDYLPLAVMAPG